MTTGRTIALPILALVPLDCAIATQDESFLFADEARLAFVLVSSLMTTFPMQFGHHSLCPHLSTAAFARQSPPRERKRRTVNSIFAEQGPCCVKRAHRMDQESFWQPHRLLRPCLSPPQRSTKKKHKNGATSGLVTSPVRPSAALGHFAGGSAHGTALVHGMSHAEVFNSVWRVVDAVSTCPGLSFRCPTDWKEQKEIAKEFAAESKAGFKGCAGAVDGMLVWTAKPAERECVEAGCGAAKFMCGRKGKFGLNLQAACDAKKKLLDACIAHPGSASDCLAFVASPLCFNLEKKGFLAPGLCTFGDNACANAPHMATPHKSIRSGPKNACNHCHSSLRINIECALGMLVQRFSILRRPPPAAVGLKKTTALVMCLCRLHNCCVDRNQKGLAPSSVADAVEAASHGGMPLTAAEENNNSPDQLSHGGEHFDDDVSHNHRQQMIRQARSALDFDEKPPGETMLEAAESEGLQRPVPAAWI